MCKKPARYYCSHCGSYFTDPGDSGHENENGPICPTCQAPATPVDPNVADHTFYCPQCKVPVHGLDAIPPDGARGLTCSACGTQLVDPPDPAGNPISLPIALKVLGMVARLLLESGAVAGLEEYARKSPNRVDDLSTHVAIALIRECAKL